MALPAKAPLPPFELCEWDYLVIWALMYEESLLLPPGCSSHKTLEGFLAEAKCQGDFDFFNIPFGLEDKMLTKNMKLQEQQLLMKKVDFKGEKKVKCLGITLSYINCMFLESD